MFLFFANHSDWVISLMPNALAYVTFVKSSQYYLNSHEYYRDDYFYNWVTHSIKERVHTVNKKIIKKKK